MNFGTGAMVGQVHKFPRSLQYPFPQWMFLSRNGFAGRSMKNFLLLARFRGGLTKIGEVENFVWLPQEHGHQR